MKQFVQQFKDYVCEGDTIKTTIDGITYQATIVLDDTLDSPEERDDGFWPNKDDPKSAGFIGEDGDLEAAIDKAKAVMEAWRNYEWFYCGIIIKATKQVEIKGRILETVELSSSAASLWGIECNYPDSDNSYLNQVANELLDEAIDYVKEVLKQLKD